MPPVQRWLVQVWLTPQTWQTPPVVNGLPHAAGLLPELQKPWASQHPEGQVVLLHVVPPPVPMPPPPVADPPPVPPKPPPVPVPAPVPRPPWQVPPKSQV